MNHTNKEKTSVPESTFSPENSRSQQEKREKEAAEKRDTVTKESMDLALRISRVSIVVNFALSLVKLAAGIIAHSGAMISDAVHSASDVFTTFVVIAGVRISSRGSDNDHQYGHERFECVASILLAFALFATGLAIGFNGIKTIMSGTQDPSKLAIPGVLALIAAILSIAVKEWMFWYTLSGAKKINSGALKADAWHHRSDALSSIGSLIGIAGARMGFPICDPLASVIICIFIVKVAVDIVKDATDKLLDKSCDEETVERMRVVIKGQQGVDGISNIKTRLFGAKVYVDVEIETDGNLSLFEAHAIAENVHHAIENSFSEVKHCMVHVDPTSPTK